MNANQYVRYGVFCLINTTQTVFVTGNFAGLECVLRRTMTGVKRLISLICKGVRNEQGKSNFICRIVSCGG